MKTTFWNWVDVSPDGFGLGKVRISWMALMVLAGAFVLAFCATVVGLLMFP
jgi:hypothetical protein